MKHIGKHAFKNIIPASDLCCLLHRDYCFLKKRMPERRTHDAREAHIEQARESSEDAVASVRGAIKFVFRKNLGIWHPGISTALKETDLPIAEFDKKFWGDKEHKEKQERELIVKVARMRQLGHDLPKSQF